MLSVYSNKYIYACMYDGRDFQRDFYQMQKWIVSTPSWSDSDAIIHSAQTGAVMEWKEGIAEHVL